MIRRCIPALLILPALAFGSAALAHSTVARSSPAANSTLQNAPREVAILFSERVEASADAIVVQDASGARVDQGNARSENNGRGVRTTLKPLAGGTYKVNWKIRSADGHVADGTFTFRVRP